MRIFRFMRKIFGPERIPTPPAKVEELLRRFDKKDSDELDVDPIEAEKRLARVVAKLSDVDQRTREIYIAIRSGHTYPEVAEAWGISVSKVKKCVVRGLLEIVKIEKMKRNSP